MQAVCFRLIQANELHVFTCTQGIAIIHTYQAMLSSCQLSNSLATGQEPKWGGQSTYLG